MIPPLDKRGLLPSGTHSCDGWAELALHFATNGHRVRLMQQLQRFIAVELAPVAKGLELYLGGSYLSDKAAPSDIDCTLVMPIAQAQDRVPLIELSADGGKGRIYLDAKDLRGIIKVKAWTPQ